MIETLLAAAGAGLVGTIIGMGIGGSIEQRKHLDTTPPHEHTWAGTLDRTRNTARPQRRRLRNRIHPHPTPRLPLMRLPTNRTHHPPPLKGDTMPRTGSLPEQLLDALDDLAALLRDAMRDIQDILDNFWQVIEDGKKRADHRTQSLTGTTPTRIDHRHVAHTHTRPDHLAGPPTHRRRTP